MNDFNKRSVGDVPAPLVENECCKCRTKLMRTKKSDSYICDECFDILQSDGGEVALAVKLERAAVVKYLRKLARGSQVETFAAAWATAADHIERGEHL